MMVRGRAAILCLVAIGACSGRAYAYQPQTGEVGILRSSSDGDTLQSAAIALVHSGNLEVLSQFLRDPAFLNRMDSSSGLKAFHLGKVLAALAEHPTPQTEDLCLALAEDPAYAAVDDRRISLLQAIVAFKPMSQRAQRFFEAANEQGYFNFNARLLTANGSPRALALFETMMLDKDESAATRVECLHVAVLPRRIELPVVQAAGEIIARASERAIALGAIESVFDFRQAWFGIESGVSGPPAWQDATPDSLRSAAALADKVLRRRDLTPSLRNKVERERATIERLLGAQSSRSHSNSDDTTGPTAVGFPALGRS